MAGPLVQLLRGRQLDDLAEIHQRHPVADVAHDREIVRDEDVGQAELLLEIGEQVENLGLDRHVEGRDRLVAHHQLRPEGQGPSHPDPLPLTTRELRREPVEMLGVESDHLHEFLDLPLALRAAGDSVDGEGVADDRPDPALRIQRPVRVLEDHLHLAPERAQLRGRELADVGAVEHHLSGRQVEQTHDAARQRRLPAPRLTDQAQGFAPAHLQADTVDGMHELLAATEAP